MNINFHYFAVKTLAIKAGLGEKEAQTIAFFSEFVDDMILNKIMKGEIVNKVSRVVVKGLNNGALYKELASKGMVGNAKELVTESQDNYSFLIPSITAFELTEALDKDHQFESVIPFHFYPKQYKAETDEKQRGDLRTSPAYEGSELFKEIDQLVNCLGEIEDEKKRAMELVKFGVLLHVYADTYAHAGFSGSKGWENNVKLVSNQTELSADILSKLGEWAAYGHTMLSHLPDLCNAKYSYQIKNAPDTFSNEIIERNNQEYFKPCAKQIYKWCYKIQHGELPEESEAEDVAREIMQKAAQVPKESDTPAKFKEMAKIWSDPNVSYEYEINKTLTLETTNETTKNGKPVYEIKDPDLLLAFTKATYDLRVKVMGKY